MLSEVAFYSSASPIPEPATSALAAGTLILFGAALRRKREK
jgi:MYXO-CTERM domain-containing protein